MIEVINRITPYKYRIKTYARIFQALRIKTNNELDHLSKFLDIFIDFLEPKGRIVIISYHSMEDRMVKNKFRELKKDLEAQKWEYEKKLAKSRRRKKLTMAEIEKRENYKWGIMFFATLITIITYLAIFAEMDKTQSHIIIQKETRALLKEDLILASNQVENLKRSDQLSKRAKKIGLIDSVPETITIELNEDND